MYPHYQNQPDDVYNALDIIHEAAAHATEQYRLALGLNVSHPLRADIEKAASQNSVEKVTEDLVRGRNTRAGEELEVDRLSKKDLRAVSALITAAVMIAVEEVTDETN